MPETTEVAIEKLNESIEEYMGELEAKEQEEVYKQKEDIIKNLMGGNFRDLGGLIAMRGFVYQYYVSMYYIIDMIYPKRESWWHSVVLEYFDDLTLIGENKIRFIQVKTIKEGGNKAHTPNDFIKRKSLKDPVNPKAHFNSWVEKNISNYDYFLENSLQLSSDKNSYTPQFEIVTNTKPSSLDDLIYTKNVNFDIKEQISEEDKIKAAILNPVQGFEFKSYFSKDVDYYLKKLYIHKLGSSTQLYENIINMIEETAFINDIRAKSIAEYVFQKLFAYVISNSHEDNEKRINKEELIITKFQIEQLLSMWVTEAKELISEISYYDTAFAMFKKVILELEKEFKMQFANEHLKNELLQELQGINERITSNNLTNSTYCVEILNKIFNGNNNLSVWDFDGDIFVYLKDSLRFIIYFLVFYDNHTVTYKTAKLLFHEGRSSVIDNILFTLYHARNNSNKVTTIEKVKLSLNECDVSRKITLELYCLLIGTKGDDVNSAASKISSRFMKVTKTSTTTHKITEIPNNMLFIDASKIEEFFEGFKNEGIYLDTFKDVDLLPEWKGYLDQIVNEVREDYIENRDGN